jgi:ribosomal protein L31
MNHLLNEVFKSTTNKSKNEIKRNIRNNIQNQSHFSENSQGIIMTTQSTKNKNSFNSTKTEGENKIIINNNNNNNLINNQNKIQNINLITMNIDTPEELHFFYINILQNGKKMESKFEITNSINP